VSARPRVDVSLCIATWRRPRALARLLESLGRIKLPEDLAVEAILVDNDPATDPAHPAAEGVVLPDIPLRRLREPRRGLAYARNRGLDAAQGRWLAFLDDDACIEEAWLASLWRSAEARDADGYFGPVLAREAGGRAPGVWPRSGDRVERRSVHVRNALLRRPLFRDLRFDPLDHDPELAWLRSQARRGVRFEWCEEAVLRGDEPGASRR
jgi:succinoglycan biosynthesis protein ExoM